MAKLVKSPTQQGERERGSEGANTTRRGMVELQSGLLCWWAVQ